MEQRIKKQKIKTFRQEIRSHRCFIALSSRCHCFVTYFHTMTFEDKNEQVMTGRYFEIDI